MAIQRYCFLLTVSHVVGSCFALLAAPTLAANEKIIMPLTAKKLVDYVRTHQVDSIESIVKALPDTYRQNIVLVHTSDSLQGASYRYPRHISFGPDARLLLTVGSVPDDPRYHFLEYAEFDPRSGTFHDGEIEFRSGKSARIQLAPRECASCHGSPWRPVWGSYPNWPNAYGVDPGAIAMEDVGAFKDYVAHIANSPNERQFDLGINLTESPSIYLKGRPFGHNPPNTVMTATLGTLVAVGAYQRMRNTPNYSTLRWLLLPPILRCEQNLRDNAGKLSAALYRRRLAADPNFQHLYGNLATVDEMDSAQIGIDRLLGVDPVRELIKDHLGDTPTTQAYYWQGYSTLQHWFAYLALDDLIQGDQEMNAAANSIAADLHENLRKIQLAGEERIATFAKEKESSWYNYFFDTFIESKYGATTAGFAVCQIVAERTGLRVK